MEKEVTKNHDKTLKTISTVKSNYSLPKSRITDGSYIKKPVC